MIMISVIVPSYKPQSYLWECLDSIRNQTILPKSYEIILILNGCLQPYKHHVEEYIKEHCNWQIRLIHTDIPGVSNARNLGIDASKGEFITFIDDDDLISPNYLEELLKVSNDTCIGCSNSYCFEETIENCNDNFISKAYKKCKEVPFSLYEYRKYLSPPVCKLIHRTIIGEVRFPVELAKSEDSVFCLQLTPKVKKMRLTGEDAIYYQRRRVGSVMRRRNSFWYEFTAFCKLEMAYLTIWLSHPFNYKCLLVLSRMAAGFKNFIKYVC